MVSCDTLWCEAVSGGILPPTNLQLVCDVFVVILPNLGLARWKLTDPIALCRSQSENTLSTSTDNIHLQQMQGRIGQRVHGLHIAPHMPIKVVEPWESQQDRIEQEIRLCVTCGRTGWGAGNMLMCDMWAYRLGSRKYAYV